MAMNVGGGSEDDVMMDINTTPLIDVMLVLIIMMIITIPIQTHAVKLDMPVGTPPPSNAPPPEVINILVDFDNTVQWNGTTIPDRQTLELHLRDAATKVPQPEVHLWPNKLAKYDTVAMVMAEAQRLGVTKLGLVGAEQFMD